MKPSKITTIIIAVVMVTNFVIPECFCRESSHVPSTLRPVRREEAGGYAFNDMHDEPVKMFYEAWEAFVAGDDSKGKHLSRRIEENYYATIFLCQRRKILMVH